MAVLFKKKYKIKSPRLQSWDYAEEGYYYVTICTENMVCYFGEIRQGKMQLSRMGKVVKKFWINIPNHYPNVSLDEYIIMPNHMHGILVIEEQTNVRSARRDGACPVSTITLGNIIGSYKSAVSKQIRKFNPNFSWQTRFYDHVIRNEKSLAEIRHYIRYNVQNWDTDEENPAFLRQTD